MDRWQSRVENWAAERVAAADAGANGGMQVDQSEGQGGVMQEDASGSSSGGPSSGSAEKEYEWVALLYG